MKEQGSTKKKTNNPAKLNIYTQAAGKLIGNIRLPLTWKFRNCPFDEKRNLIETLGGNRKNSF